MRIKLVFISLISVIGLIGMENNVVGEPFVECHKKYFPSFLQSIQTTRKIIFNFQDFADANHTMMSQTKIIVGNGCKNCKRYFDDQDEKIVLYSKGNPQAYLNLSNLREKALQDIGEYESSWTIINDDDQNEVDASVIIYNISKDCAVSMSEHVANIKCLKDKKGKNKFKHLLINIDQKRTDRSVIDDLIKEIEIVKPVELIVDQEKDIILESVNMNLVVKKNDDPVVKKDVGHTRFKYCLAILNAIWSNKVISSLAIIALFIGFSLRYS